MDVDRERNLTTFTVAGQTTAEEQIRALDEFYSSEPTLHTIWDFRQITGQRISTEDLKRIIGRERQQTSLRAGGKTALVTKTDLDFGLGRMADTFAELEKLPYEIRTFRSIDKAIEWLEERQG
jgi:hypothetical protein